MDRRSFATAFSFLLAAHANAPAEAPAQPRHKISGGQLHQALSARFPLRLTVGGFLGLQLHAPALLLLPRRNRLGATLMLETTSAWMTPPPGEVDVVFALRYEASDRSVRALQPELLALRWPGLPREMGGALQQALPALAREALGEIVLHTFTARELALPDAMGLQPEELTVLDDGLQIVFGPQR